MLGQLAALALVVATQNVRVTLPPPEAQHDIRQAAAGRTSIVLTQEMGRRAAWKYRPAGWGSAHFPYGVRRADCATYFDRARWRKVSAWPRQISYAPFVAGHRWALITVLRDRSSGVRVATVCVHLITRTLARSAVFERSTDRLRAIVGRLRARYGAVVVGGDWNRPWRQRAPFLGCRTLPARAVDYIWGCGVQPMGSRAIRHTYSDHDGVRMWMRGG